MLAESLTYPPVDNLIKRLLPDWVTVFMLHRLAVPEVGVEGMEPAYLTQCLEKMRADGCNFISLEEAVSRAAEQRLGKEKWVAFSLDDGCFEQVEIAGEIFARYDCPATCFLITDYIDGKLWEWEHQVMWLTGELKNRGAPPVTLEYNGCEITLEMSGNKPHKAVVAWIRRTDPSNAYALVRRFAAAAGIDVPTTPPPEYRPASWSSIRAMEKRGMNFAPHTVTHRIVSGLSDTELEREVVDSIARVNAECERAAPVFCYPSGKKGEYDERTVRLLEREKMAAAFIAEPGYLSGPQLREQRDYRYLVPRMTIPDTLSELRRYTSSAQYLREKLAS
jgi:peptidoglycan/xylan/chitin deacetylase (PgdA/CDA1 family)